MKKLYTVLLTALVALVCSFNANAQDDENGIRLILNVDRGGAVEWKNAYGSPWEALSEGDNEIVVTPYYGTYYYLYIRPAMGYQIDGIASSDPDAYPGLRDYTLSELSDVTYYPSDEWVGRKYVITTTDVNAARSGALTVNVVGNPSLVTARYNGSYNNITFAEEGETVIKFNPESELPLTFNASSQPFYSFKLNGTEVAPSGTSYEITPATTGDRVDIETSWPDLDVNFTVTVPEGLEGAVKSVQKQDGWSYYDVEGWKVNEAFTVKAGNRYKVNFNTTDYTINGSTLNGEPLSGSYSVDFFVGKDDVTVNVDAVVKEAFKFYLRAERAGEAEFDVTYGSSYVKLEAGDNEVRPRESYWGGYESVYMRAVNGYKITRVYDAATEDELTVPSDPANSMTLNPSDSWQNRVYVVETMNLDGIRTAKVGITVTDDPSAVVRAQRANSDITLGAAGERIEVKFDPATESVFTFAGNSIPLCEVKLNGQVVATETPSGTTHKLTVADGDEIVITAKYDDIDVPVTIMVPEDAKAVIKTVEIGTTYPYTAVEWTPNEEFMVKAGSRVNIDFDKNAANLKGVTVKAGTDTQYDAPYSVNFFVKYDAIDVEVDAAPYNMLKFTVNVTDPSHVSVYPGESTYGNTPFVLEGTTTQLEVSEKLGKIVVAPNSGYIVKSVTDADGNTLEKDPWSSNAVYTITDGMTVNIETAEIVYDGKFALWFDTTENLADDGFSKTYWQSEEDRYTYHYIEEAGYQLVKFQNASPYEHGIVVYPTEYARVYLNGELAKTSESWSKNVWYYFTPKDGDVVRVFTTVDEPSKYDLTFNVTGDNPDLLEDAVVTTDLLTVQSDWRNGLNLLEQTLVSLEIPAGVGVMLDGESLEAGEDGKYTFTTSATHEVTLSTMSGIINLDGDSRMEAPAAVYNLQGIKVLDDATNLKKLPAGIYIVNGQKRVIR